jgi:hypothetical protein
MAITLTHYEPFGENKELEITVSYDRHDQIWLSIDNVAIVQTSAFIDKRELLRLDITDEVETVSELSVAIEKIANRVDWRELYSETVNQ